MECPFFLKRIILGGGLTDDANGPGLDLISLPLARRFDQSPHYGDAESGAQGLYPVVAGKGGLRYHLEVADGGAIVDLDEGEVLG